MCGEVGVHGPGCFFAGFDSPLIFLVSEVGIGWSSAAYREGMWIRLGLQKDAFKSPVAAAVGLL